MKAAFCLVPAAYLIVASGCIFVDADSTGPRRNDPYVDTNREYAPQIISIDASLSYDDTYRDDVWYFAAEVTDSNGTDDIETVWADVYDGYNTLVEQFELSPTAYVGFWETSYWGSEVGLDPYYSDYWVEFIVYDWTDATARETTWLTTYDLGNTPSVNYSQAFVWWSSPERADVWTFETSVSDYDYDVIDVWAHVYDDGILIESFELIPDGRESLWYADFWGAETTLDVYYPYYEVVFVATDALGNTDAESVYALSY